MSDQYEKGVLKVLRYVYNQMERCRNADFDALGITSSQASVMMFLFKNRKHEVTQQSAAVVSPHNYWFDEASRGEGVHYA